MSINDLARDTGLSPQQILRLENNESWFSRSILEKACDALDCHPSDLLELSEDSHSSNPTRSGD